MLLSRIAVLVEILHVAERYAAVAEVHRRRNAELEVCVYAVFAHYAHVESGVPAVLVGSDESLDSSSVFTGYDLRTGIQQFDVLHVRAYDHSEMERTQVGVGSVLHRARLRCGMGCTDDNCEYRYNETFHIRINNAICFCILYGRIK